MSAEAAASSVSPSYRRRLATRLSVRDYSLIWLSGLHASPYGSLVALDGPELSFLIAPAQRPSRASNVSDLIPCAEALGNDQSEYAKAPQVRVITRRPGAAKQRSLQGPQCRMVKFEGTAGILPGPDRLRSSLQLS